LFPQNCGLLHTLPSWGFVAMRRGTSKWNPHKKARWTEQQKLQAVATYVMLGNLTETALATEIPRYTLREWKVKDWWKDLVNQIREEDVQQLDSNLQRVIQKALKATEDRLDAGEYQYDPKTGKVIRIPVKANIALKITTELLTKQEHMRDKPERMEVEKTIDARLAKLADEFVKFSSARTINGKASNNLTAIEAVVVSPSSS